MSDHIKIKSLHWPSLLLVSAFVLLITACRMIGIGQYPAIHPDEGFWAGGARNFALFHDPFLDDRLHALLSPATFVALSGVFELVSPSLVSARLFSAVLGILSCCLFADLARRVFPGRPWIPAVLFGFSSLGMVINRTILLESHQMFWLVSAALFWLRSTRIGVVAAGAAFGVALLVKSNSLYLLPAFLLTAGANSPFLEPRRQQIETSGVFLVSVAAIAGGGYLLTWWLQPERFVAAFRFELDGKHFLDEGVAFHVGRFGFHPRHAWSSLTSLVTMDPLLLALSLAGAICVMLRPMEPRTDRFFLAWAVGGLLFHFSQIYVPYRYFATLAPAFAYLSARAIARLCDGSRAWRLTAFGLLACFVIMNVGRVGAGVLRHANADYWQTVAWISDHVPRRERLLAAPVVGLSLPQQSYDFFRLLFPYSGGEQPLADVVERYGITYIVTDPEWREYETGRTADFLTLRGTSRFRLGDYAVYEIRRAGP